MARPKGAPNDQGEIIENLKNKNFNKVWESVKYIGYKDMPDVTMRFLIFKKAVNSFDPFRNNNFIMFFKSHIRYSRMKEKERDHFKYTNNSTIISHIKTNVCSPQENLPILMEELLQIIG